MVGLSILLLHIVLVAVLLAVTPQHAMAHEPWSVENWGYVWVSPNDCVWDHAYLDHGWGAGYVYSRVRVDGNGTPPVFCGYEWDAAPGHLEISLQLIYWDGGGWIGCDWSGYFYNDTWDHDMEIRYLYPGEPWCGPGDYANKTWGYHLTGDWRGGSTWSGPHYLPS